MPITEQMEDSFTMVMISFARAGSTFLMAWGSAIERRMRRGDKR